MEFESVATELYALRPAEFIAARDDYAAQAREAGDRKLTDRIRRLRRPSLAAWATNLLVQRQPQEVHQLLELGEELREAHQTLDAKHLQQLGRQQHLVTSSMARQAQKLANEAGRRIGDSVVWEVEATLHAAVADADAAHQLATGRLTKALTPPTELPAITRSAVGQKSGAPPPPTPTPAHHAEDATERDRRRRTELEAARSAAEEAEAAAQARSDERRTADATRQAAEAELEECQEQAAALTAQLKEAQRHESEVEDRLNAARAQAREAVKAERTARRRAQQEAEELARQQRKAN